MWTGKPKASSWLNCCRATFRSAVPSAPPTRRPLHNDAFGGRLKVETRLVQKNLWVSFGAGSMPST